MKNCKSECEGCLRMHLGRCDAFTVTYKSNCPSKCVDPYKMIREINAMMKVNASNLVILPGLRERLDIVQKHIEKDINSVYMEDQHRGGKGGGSKEGSNAAAAKAKMKDNRPLECKQTKTERDGYYNELNEWQEGNGKLEVHKTVGYGMNRTKVDSYTGQEMDTKGNLILNDDEIIDAANKLLEEGKIDIFHYEDIIYGRVELK